MRTFRVTMQRGAQWNRADLQAGVLGEGHIWLLNSVKTAYGLFRSPSTIPTHSRSRGRPIPTSGGAI
jgi:hypothetical protein